MWDWRKCVVNPNANPVRREANLLSMPDPDSGKMVVIPLDENILVLSPEGSPDSVKLAIEQFHRCRCSLRVPVGGRCYQCGGTSCIHCHGHCAACHKPICPEHSQFVQEPAGQQMRLCQHCYAVMRRKKVTGIIARVLLCPFVKFQK